MFVKERSQLVREPEMEERGSQKKIAEICLDKQSKGNSPSTPWQHLQGFSGPDVNAQPI